MRIIIRHAEKEYKNGSSRQFSHDPGITDAGRVKCISVAKELIEKYGMPKSIIVSPYRRTRETATAMCSYIESIKKDLPLVQCDINISEYLGNHRETLLDVNDDTLAYNPPHPESYRDFSRRVSYHDSYYGLLYDNCDTDVVWFITHGIVINYIYLRQCNRKLNKVRYLGFINSQMWTSTS
jgi:broad specificity phosphatase PhoE